MTTYFSNSKKKSLKTTSSDKRPYLENTNSPSRMPRLLKQMMSACVHYA